jgi:FAD binding domain
VRISAPDLAGLQGALAGSVLVPGSPGYESARTPALARFHHLRPQAIVRCHNADDVAETLAFARRWGVRVAPRSGGHCFAGRSSTEGIVLDVTPMHAVSVSGGRATVGAGARLGDLYDALQQHEVTIPAGCGPTVGIAGLTLGGGLGILGRKYGLTCDQLVAARVVLADGRVVDCDQHHHGELFWALRGAGGGHFGVVTSLVFSVLPAPAATRFHLTWPHAHAAAVIAAWQAWAPDAPDELNANLMLTAAGGSDRPPTVHVFGAMLADQAETVALLDQLVAWSAAEPASASHTRLPYRDLKRSLVGLGGADEDGEPERPGHVFSKSEFFRRPLPPEAITALLRNLPRGWGAGQSRALNFTPLGARTTGCPPTRPRTCTATSGSWSSTWPWSTPRPQRPREAPHGNGWRGRGLACTPGGPGACTRTSPTLTSRTGPRPTTGPTTSALFASSEPTTRRTSSGSSSRSDPPVQLRVSC